jgi:hypothetical protein
MSGHTIPFTNIVIAVRKQHAVRMVDKEPSNIKAVDKELSNNGWWTRNCPIIGRWTRNRPIIGRWTRNRPMLVRWTRSSPILGRRTRNRAILGGWCKELSNIGWWTRNRPWRSITHSRALTHNAFAQRTLRSRSHAPAAPPLRTPQHITMECPLFYQTRLNHAIHTHGRTLTYPQLYSSIPRAHQLLSFLRDSRAASRPPEIGPQREIPPEPD